MEAPAEPRREPRGAPTPEAAVRAHFAAIQAHDLAAILATLSPERGRLYEDHRTLDRRRLTIARVELLSVEPAGEAVPLPVFASRYTERLILKVEYEQELVEREERRDPTAGEGRQWAFFVLVRDEEAGDGWMIADWGR